MSRTGGEAPGAVQGPYMSAAGSTEVILVRHGAAQDLELGERSPLIDGRDDPPLSALGLAQAEAVSARLAQQPFDRLFVSPLMRTAMTVAPLAAQTGHDIEVLPDLIEVFLGEYEGRRYRTAAAEKDPVLLRVHAEERWDVLPGSESTDAVRERVARGMRHVVEHTGPDAVAIVVSHGGVIGEACRVVTGSRPFAFLAVENASLTRLVLGPDGGWLLRSFNDTTHLEGIASR